MRFDADAAQGPARSDGDGAGPEVAEAVTALFDEHYTRMLRVAAMLLGDASAAEDVVQDAFMSVHAAWGRIKDTSQAAGYLHRCVVNTARSRLRRRAVAARLPLTRRTVAPSAEDDALAELGTGPLLTALRSLPRREREVVVLRHYLDLSERQTAEALGLQPGSVKAYGSRGLATLRSTLDDLFEYQERRR